MREFDLVAEADRQLAVCNACRYCESFCAVFPALEMRSAIGSGDLGYLANLCHDCRMCYDACMFTPPHEYGINVPQLFAQARVETYEAYSAPPLLAKLFRAPRSGALFISLIGIAIVLAGIGIGTGIATLTQAQSGSGAFYRVVPYLAMVVPALVLAAFGFGVLANAARRYARDIRGAGAPPVTRANVARAVHEALSLVYLKGGGVGCYDVHRGSQSRRVLHSLVFWGFLSDLASTTSAFIYQDFLGWAAPYPLRSIPVVLGTLGGIAICIGTAGLMLVKNRSDERPLYPAMIAMDYAFLGLLFAVASTGLVLLVLRATSAMPVLLAVHLGCLVGLFVTMPYGKFVHFIYRFIALVQNAAERQNV